MRFLSFSHNGKASFGAAIDDKVVDLGERHPELADLRAAIREDQLESLASRRS